METFIRIDKNNKGMITYIHSAPFDPVNGMGKSRDELLKEGYLIEDFPAPKMVEGKRAIPYYDIYTNTVSYDYVLIPDSPENKINYIENALNEFFLSYQKENQDLNQQMTEAQTALVDIYELMMTLMV